MTGEIKSVIDWLNSNYSQESENYDIFFGSKRGVIKYNDHIAISTWGCGAVVCIYDRLVFLGEDDGNWFVHELEHYGPVQTGFSIAWAKGFAEAITRLNEYVEKNGKPVYFSGTDVVCHYKLG